MKNKQHRITERLRELFEDHKGRKRGLTQQELLRYIYGSSKADPYTMMNRWISIKGGMRRLRKDLDYFVVNRKLGNSRVYYITSNVKDSAEWLNWLDKVKEGIDGTIKRCKQASNPIMIRAVKKKGRKR